ncbi:MAG: hypothetical protein IPK21_18465 [Haliscomenobacter sp.]|nr:hypothetical protein [Haliscomenobacter sp.]
MDAPRSQSQRAIGHDKGRYPEALNRVNEEIVVARQKVYFLLQRHQGAQIFKPFLYGERGVPERVLPHGADNNQQKKNGESGPDEGGWR